MVNIADTIGDWVTFFGWEDIPENVIWHAKRCLIDVIGVAFAGSKRSGVILTRKATQKQFALGPCTIIGSKAVKSCMEGAALINGIAAHVLDFDDTCYDGIVHGSAAVWPAANAAAEAARISGKDFLLAFIAGVETEYALGRLVTNHLYWKGWWNSGLLGSLGAAGAAAKAFKLNNATTRNAIRIAACLTTGLRVVLGTPVKPFVIGWASQIGIRSALLAMNGISGPGNVFEDDRGFLKLYNDGNCDLKALVELGKRFSLEKPGVALKRYPVCSAAQAAVEATQNIIIKETLANENIARVHCEVTPLVGMSLVYNNPVTVTQAQFSMPFAIGCILSFNELGIKQLNDLTINNSLLKANMQKVTMATSQDFFPLGNTTEDFPEAAKVTIYTKDGKQFQYFNGGATGMPCKPMSDKMIEDKFCSCTSKLLSKKKASELLSQLWSVEKLKSTPVYA
jgi:2-methylcitrate dehydratase PrpD